MADLLNVLARGLDSDVRRALSRRIEVLERRLNHLIETDDETLDWTRGLGWSDTKLRVICVLNSFYQIVLYPLAFSAKNNAPLGLGTSTPILHGSMRLDSSRSRDIRQAYSAFLGMLQALDLSERIVAAPRLDDIMNRLIEE